jgi:RNA polymerase sigma-70 factor (ECF subfamily)
VNNLSQNAASKHYTFVQSASETREIEASLPDFETVFHHHYDRIARAVARIVGDTACAEELAMEAFWKYWRTPLIHGAQAGGWIYRTAVNLGLYELRRRARHARYEKLLRFRRPSTPEEIHASTEEQKQVRCVLANMKSRDAELLVLREEDFTYEELAALLALNPASVGTLISRARQSFRKEYVRLYGEPRMGE